jgi:hypothetical protein
MTSSLPYPFGREAIAERYQGGLPNITWANPGDLACQCIEFGFDDLGDAIAKFVSAITTWKGIPVHRQENIPALVAELDSAMLMSHDAFQTLALPMPADDSHPAPTFCRISDHSAVNAKAIHHGTDEDLRPELDAIFRYFALSSNSYLQI